MTKYRDPRPDEIREDEPIALRFAPPEVQAYYRQVVSEEEQYGAGAPRWMNSSSTDLQTAALCFMLADLTAAIRSLADK